MNNIQKLQKDIDTMKEENDKNVVMLSLFALLIYSVVTRPTEYHATEGPGIVSEVIHSIPEVGLVANVGHLLLGDD